MTVCDDDDSDCARLYSFICIKYAIGATVVTKGGIEEIKKKIRSTS